MACTFFFTVRSLFILFLLWASFAENAKAQGGCTCATNPGSNLIVNGDFETLPIAPIAGVLYNWTNYNGIGCTPPSGYGTYSISSNPHRCFSRWAAVDHTFGDSAAFFANINSSTIQGHFLLIDPNTTPGVVYTHTVPNLCPNTLYNFSFWAKDMCSYPDASRPSPIINIRLNGVDQYATPLTISKKTAYGGANPLAWTGVSNWTPMSTCWNSGANTSVTVEIYNAFSGTMGNDLGIDDIVLTTCTPALNVSAGPASICPGGSATLTATGMSNYSWSPSTGLSATTGSSVTATPAVTTTYIVTGDVGGGCVTASNQVTVTVSACGPTVIAPPATLCAGACASLTATGSGGTPGYTYTWNPGGFVGNPFNACPPGTTTYTVIARDGAGLTASTTAVVTINPNPTLTSSPQTICAGSNATITASGAATYTWSTGSQTPGITVTPPSTTTYTVKGTSAFGCTGTTSVAVTVNPLPVITATPATICAGDNATITASGANTYTWNTGAQTQSISVSPGATTTYTVSGTTAGCTGFATVIVTVNNGITVPVPPATICVGGSTTLTAGGSAVSYTWSTGAQTQSITVNPTVTSTYTVSGTSASGCTGTGSVVVTVNPLPSITTSPATVCLGSAATVSANGAATYTWSTGATGSSLSVTPLATTTYTVNGISALGCTGTASVVVTVNPNPTITVPPATICAGDNATLIASGATNYIWSTGATGGSISVSPTVTTTYMVIGSDANGCTGTAMVVVTINNGITVPVTPVTICAGVPATLTAGGSATTYTWSTGAQTQSITENPTVTTTYTVSGTSTSGCTGTGSVVVTVNPIPVLFANAGTICQGSCINLTASGASTYTWSPSSGLSTINGASVSACPTVSTMYTITGTSPAGCTSDVQTNVLVNPIPIVTVNSEIICSGSSATLTASGASTYTWSTGSQTTGVTLSPTQTTNYWVIGSTNGCSATALATITVNPIPTVSVNSFTVCAGVAVNLTASGATSYTWMPGNTNGSSLNYTPTASTSYTIMGSVAGGCTNSTMAGVLVNPVPIVNFEPDTAACVPLRVTFSNLSQANLGSSSCQWTFTGGVPNFSNNCVPAQVLYNNPGVYSATLTVTSNGCSATLVRPNIITVYSYPQADFNASPQHTTIWNPTVFFKDLSLGNPVKLLWTFEDGECQTDSLTDSISNPQHTYCDTGRFDVCLTVWNQNNCPNTICKEIVIGPDWTFYIPNAFSPNKDGFNDFFIGKSWNIVEHEMWIFDRWGNMIYYTGKTKDPESSIPWDGRANGGIDPAQEDVYVWVVQLRDIFSKKHKYIGHVTLVK